MILRLSALPKTLQGPSDPAYKGQVPLRARFLAPDAAAALLQVEKDTGGLIYTDIFRSASSSLEAHRTKSGVQPPGHSTHGYGLAADVDIDATLKKLKCSYTSLLPVLEARNWFCYRRDIAPDKSEGWHFTYLADPTWIGLTDAGGQWAAPGEAAIQARYGEQMQLSAAEVSAALETLKYADVAAFQKDWDLAVDGVAGPQTQRLLAYVTSKISLEAIP